MTNALDLKLFHYIFKLDKVEIKDIFSFKYDNFRLINHGRFLSIMASFAA